MIVGLCAVIATVVLAWPRSSGEPAEGGPAEAATPPSVDDSPRVPTPHEASRGPECPHRYIPFDVGTELEYRWWTSEARGSLMLELVEIDEVEGESIARWRSSVRADGAPEVTSDFGRACSAERGAEEPWVGHGAGQRTLRFDRQTWRWPARLELGATFDGDVTVVLAGRPLGEVHRTHRVLAREPIEVEAGAFDAVRVETIDRHGSTEIRSTWWVADGIGLVRSEESLGGPLLVHELARVTVPSST